MNFHWLLIIVSLSIVLNMSDAEKTIGNMENRLKLLEVKKYINKTPSIEQRDAILRKKRSASSFNAQKKLVANEMGLNEINNTLPINMGDTDHQKRTVVKRHACRNLKNRWNHFRFGRDNDNNYKEVKSEKRKDSSEKSEEVNTEDPFYVESAENISKKQEEKMTIQPQNSSDNKRRKNISKHENHNKNNESKNVKHDKNNDAENEKRKDSSESADKEEYIFTNVPREISENKENKNRKDNDRHNHRVERDVIEEENVATTASGFKFTSGYADFGSRVSFRNINV